MFKITKFNICVIGMLAGVGLISLLPFIRPAVTASSETTATENGLEKIIDKLVAGTSC